MKKKLNNRDVIKYGFLFLMIFVFLCGCATTKISISEEEFFGVWRGTWVNTDIEGSVWIPQKLVTHPDGTFGFHVFLTDSIPFCTHTFVLIDQWADSKNNIWFSAKTTCPIRGHIFYEYGRIKDAGNTLEYIHHVSDAPIEKWEPDNEYYNYCIFYRE